MSQFRLNIIYFLFITLICHIQHITSNDTSVHVNSVSKNVELSNEDSNTIKRKEELQNDLGAEETNMKDSNDVVNDTPKPIKLPPEKPVNVTSSIQNGTLNSNFNTLKHMSMNSGAMLRGFYLLLGLSVILVLYFAFRAFRLRKSRAERKYGILRQDSDTQELTPLPLGLADDDSDGDDHTVFELRRPSDHV